MTDDNGILAKISGLHIAGAIHTLPPAETATEESMTTETEVPDFGLVRFTAKRIETKKGRSRHYFWSVTRAVKV